MFSLAAAIEAERACGSLQTAETYDPTTGTFTVTTAEASREKRDPACSDRCLQTGPFSSWAAGKAADIFNPDQRTALADTAGIAVKSQKSHGDKAIRRESADQWWLRRITSRPIRRKFTIRRRRAFTATSGVMMVPRANHTAHVCLPSGAVFITGGFSGTSPHAETEIYDPGTANVYHRCTTMLFNRSNHRAILQGDGKVLVIGGVTLESGFLAVNELYDPATQIWTEHGAACSKIAALHTATALQTGTSLWPAE